MFVPNASAFVSGEAVGKARQSEGDADQTADKTPEQRVEDLKKKMEEARAKWSRSNGKGGGGGHWDKISNNTLNLPPGKSEGVLSYMEKIAEDMNSMAERSRGRDGSRRFGGGGDRDWHHKKEDFYRRLIPLYKAGVLEGTPLREKAKMCLATESCSGGLARGRAPSDIAEEIGNTWGSNPFTERLRHDAYVDENNARKAAEAAQKWALMAPEDSEAHTALGKANYDLGNYAEAYQSGMRALELDRNNLKALTLVKTTRGYAGPATAAAAGASGGNPPSAPAFNYQQTAYSPSFRDPVDPVKVTGPDSAQLRSSKNLAAKAEAMLRNKDYAQAARLAARATELNPENLKARYYHSLALLQQNNFQDALKATDDALKYAPNNSIFLTARAKALNQMKQYDAAFGAANLAIAADGTNAEAYLQKAWALDGIGARRAEVKTSLSGAVRYAATAAAREKYQNNLADFENFSDGELAMLLGGEGFPEKKPETGEGWSGVLGKKKYVMMGLAGVVGGFLVALGLLRSASGGWSVGLRRLRMFFTQESPEVGDFAHIRAVPTNNGTNEYVSEALLRSYAVEREIGVGGMGIVYSGTDRALERPVAIKKMREEIRSDARERDRFISEARTVATLHHPNIVEIFSIVEDGRDAFLIFEYVDGQTVHDVIQSRRALPFSEAVGVLQGCAGALDYAHKRGVIHRDLKPSNVMINTDRQVKVMDFGVARLAKDSMTRLSRTNTVVGTPPYMAPEQEQGIVRKGSDIFALGVMLYEMVTGQLPFQGVGAGMLMAKINGTYVPASRIAGGLPAGFDEVLARALDPDPDKRFQTAGEFARHLGALAVAR
jgi:tetratricopeptide (TPR) repeat protein